MAKFIITDRAPKEVAGLPNAGAGREIELSELQAEHPLRVGHIKRAPVAKPEPKKPEPKG